MSTKNITKDDLLFGELLRRTRKARGATQDDLAVIFGASKGHISAIEKGLRKPGTHLKVIIDDWISAEGTSLPEQDSQDDLFPFSEEEALEQTRYVIRSKTVYRSALLSNIRAFYQGVRREEEMEGMEKRMARMEDKHDADMAELKLLLRQALSHVDEQHLEKKSASF